MRHTAKVLTRCQVVSNAHTQSSQLQGIAGQLITVLCDQVDDLFHDDIVVVILEFGHCFDEATNLDVDVRLEFRTSKVILHRLNLIRQHIAGRPENATEDKGKVYDVGHHKADILIAVQRVGADEVVQEERTHLFS